MPLEISIKRLTTFSAHMKGIVKAVPKSPKLVLTGEAFVLNNSPTVSCHQGYSIDTNTTMIVVMPPAKPNQFIL